MQPRKYTLEETLNSVQGLNKQGQPFVYRVEGSQIIGEWKHEDNYSMGSLNTNRVDNIFRIIVKLDETNHTYRSKDIYSQNRNMSSYAPGQGTFQSGKGYEYFWGYSYRRYFNLEIDFKELFRKLFGKGTQKKVVSKFSFTTSEIKDPLFKLLEQCGWQKRNWPLW